MFLSKLRFGVGICPHPEVDNQGKNHIHDIYKYLDSLDNVYESAWVSDHLIPSIEPYDTDNYECLTLTSYLLPQYQNLKFGQLVLCNNYRNPALLAKMSATLQVLSEGRFILGIGAGWLQEEYKQYGYKFPSPRTRVKQLEEAVQIIKLMWTEDNITFHGKHYRIENAVCNPKPDPVPPIMIAGWGEKYSLKVVARYADWWNGLCTSVKTWSHQLDVLANHCDDVDRDYDDILKTADAIITLAGSDEEALKLAQRSRFPKEWSLIGSPETLVSRMGELVDAGVEYFQLNIIPFPDFKATKLFADEVIPELT